MKPSEKRDGLDEPRNVDRLYHGLLFVCALLVALVSLAHIPRRLERALPGRRW